jgi:TctA family transporter
VDLLHNLIYGLGVALSFQNLAWALLGCLVGTLIGVLPGIGTTATIALLLPLTQAMSPIAAIIMLSGIYYGAMYGGSTTSILLNLPGETASVVTCIDGFQMARQGRAGVALSVAALGSFFAGTVGTLVIALFGPPLAEYALDFGSAEYFSLMLFGLVIAAVLSSTDLPKSLAMVVLGLLIGTVGSDLAFGVKRFTFGIYELSDGISVVAIAVGVFAIAEVIMNLSEDPEKREVYTSRVGRLYPTLAELRQAAPAVLRGTAIGTFFGVIPGAVAAIAAFSSYTIEKTLAKDPSRFGKGAIEGVAAPESANNADVQCKFIPMMTLGIPASGTMALMLNSLLSHGISPGPTVMSQHPDLFWGLIASMWIGNLMLVIINLPLIGVWIQMLKVPYRMLFPAIIAFAATGIYSDSYSALDLYLVALFAVAGIAWRLLECGAVPLILGVVLGPLIEQNLRRVLYVSDGDPTVLLTQPISLFFILATVATLVIMTLPSLRKRRAELTEQES